MLRVRHCQGRHQVQSIIYRTRSINFTDGSGLQISWYDRSSESRSIRANVSAHVGSSQSAENTGEKVPALVDTTPQSKTEHWYTIEEPVVPHARNSDGHSLAGLLLERRVEDIFKTPIARKYLLGE